MTSLGLTSAEAIRILDEVGPNTFEPPLGLAFAGIPTLAIAVGIAVLAVAWRAGGLSR